MKILFVALTSLFMLHSGQNKLSFDPKKDLVYVPGGGVFLGNIILNKDGVAIPTQLVPPFYIGTTEVTNRQYNDFIEDLKINNKNWQDMLPDTAAWRLPNSYNEPLVSHYFQHSKYANYPVVGITLTQAISYTNWLSTQYPAYTFSIPTKAQWVSSARKDPFDNYTHAWFQDVKGRYNYNFKQLTQNSVSYDTSSGQYVLAGSIAINYLEDGYLYPAEAKSFTPNPRGVYEMCGNVAELVLDDNVALGGSWNDTGYDIRIISEKPAKKAECTIGFRIAATLK